MDQRKKISWFLKKLSSLRTLFLILITLFLLCLAAFKNLENRQSSLFKAHYFKGRVQVQKFYPNWVYGSLKMGVDLTYTEEVDGKVYTIPLQKDTYWSELALPPYTGEQSYIAYDSLATDSSKKMNYFPVSMYAPIIEEALISNKDYRKVEEKMSSILRSDPRLSGATIQFGLSITDQVNDNRGFSWVGEEMMDNIRHGKTAFGGAGAISIEDAVKNRLLYVDITLPVAMDSSDQIDLLEKSLEKIRDERGLPDGLYHLNSADYSFIVKEGKIERGR